LLKLFQAMLDSEDILLQERDNRHGNSIEHPILSSLITLEATQCISNLTELVHT
jgi:hypothetical protein